MTAKEIIASIPRFIANVRAEYHLKEIEGSLVGFFIDKNKLEPVKYSGTFIDDILEYQISEIKLTLAKMFDEIDLEMITDIFEAMLEEDEINENGMVFTPMYIVDYIYKNTVEQDYMKHSQSWHQLPMFEPTKDLKIMDPSCGCGIFLLGALENINKSTNRSKVGIVSDNLYGIDLNEQNVRRCQLILALSCLQSGEHIQDIRFNIIAGNSLDMDWNQIFQVTGFDFIVGNPPYVNPHNMNLETVNFLKQNFTTTKSGVFNIFYAFIEKSIDHLNSDGRLGFILPNNFLTIKSAEMLRSFIQNKRLLKLVVDFDDNMIFKPVRTYNAIVIMDKTDNTKFLFRVLRKTDDIESELNKPEWHEMDQAKLDKHGWKLIREEDLKNISIIENQVMPIKGFIRTGIATLRDNVYILECEDSNGFFKVIDGEKLYIEKELVKTLYKIPDIKNGNDIEQFRKKIIFPYKLENGQCHIISETELAQKYPICYKYFLSMSNELNKRDKGKPNSVAWYAYGRTQGLTKYGCKLLFPTFANKPRFILEEDNTALFCNGYAVFENDFIDLRILSKILNSKVMEYYIDRTSYSIEGGYKCYQKKYIERFSLPLFRTEELAYLSNTHDPDEIDRFLVDKYGLDMDIS